MSTIFEKVNFCYSKDFKNRTVDDVGFDYAVESFSSGIVQTRKYVANLTISAGVYVDLSGKDADLLYVYDPKELLYCQIRNALYSDLFTQLLKIKKAAIEKDPRKLMLEIDEMQAQLRGET